MTAVELRIVDGGSPAAQWAMGEYFAELSARFPAGFDPGDGLREAATSFNPPLGVFVVATLGGETVGCGALLWLDSETAEIKRMWVSGRARGQGIGRLLLVRLEAEAGAAGRRTIFLDTNGVLLEAIAMYRGSGYVETERYNDNPYAERWFTKTLTA